MKEKTFRIVVSIVVALGMLSTAVLLAVTYYLHGHCSIISFIANGG